MATEPRPLQIQQLQAFLTAEFDGFITGIGTDNHAKERNFLTKALAAYALMCRAGADKRAAVDASIDGGDDHGIDSVFIGPTGVIWLVQAKYIHDGNGEPKLGDASKFKDGVIDLVRGKFDRFNDALQSKLPRLKKAMEDDYHVRFVLAHTGTTLNDDRIQMFRDVEESINAIQPARAQFFRLGLFDFHDALIERHGEQAISAEVELRNFGMIERPARAFYGVMRVGDLATLYQKYEHALVRANIRRYRGSSRVNEQMLQTLRERPEHFVYYNNGVTLLCDRLTSIDTTDPQRRSGRFRLEGVSIINGAQTAGTVAREAPAHYQAHPADVMVTCIQATPDLEGFGDRVTEYRNSQNAVELRDFIALDDNQENWRRTLEASDVTYIYKQSASDPHATGNVFTAQEAANYLLMANGETSTWAPGLVLLATHPDRLWDRQLNLSGEVAASEEQCAYRRLFSYTLTARRLWRTTQIGRLVRQAVQDDAATQGPGEAALALASMNLVGHIVLTRLRSLTDGPTLTLTPTERNEVSLELDRVRRAVSDAYTGQNWGDATPADVFSEVSNLMVLKSTAMRTLSQPATK